MAERGWKPRFPWLQSSHHPPSSASALFHHPRDLATPPSALGSLSMFRDPGLRSCDLIMVQVHQKLPLREVGIGINMQNNTRGRAPKASNPPTPRCLWDSELAAAGLPFREDLTGTEPGPAPQRAPPAPKPTRVLESVCERPGIKRLSSHVCWKQA